MFILNHSVAIITIIMMSQSTCHQNTSVTCNLNLGRLQDMFDLILQPAMHQIFTLWNYAKVLAHETLTKVGACYRLSESLRFPFLLDKASWRITSNDRLLSFLHYNSWSPFLRLLSCKSLQLVLLSWEMQHNSSLLMREDLITIWSLLGPAAFVLTFISLKLEAYKSSIFWILS